MTFMTVMMGIIVTVMALGGYDYFDDHETVTI